MLDLLIRDAEIVDGTGAPARHGDVGVRDGRIVAVGSKGKSTSRPRKPLTQKGRRSRRASSTCTRTTTRSCSGIRPRARRCSTASPPCSAATAASRLAPAGPDQQDYLTRMLARVEGMPLDALRAGLDWQWSSFGDWLARLDGRIGRQRRLPGGPQCDSAGGDGRRRGRRRGDARADRKDGRAARCRAGDGALGLSTSQSNTHNDGEGQPVPSRSASREELLALAAAVRAHPGTQLEAIIPGCLSGFTDDDIALLTDMSIAADRPLNWNVLGVSAGNPEGHEKQLRASEVAAERGGRVVALTLPHSTKIRLSFLSGFVLDGLPGWRETMHLPVAERHAGARRSRGAPPAQRGRPLGGGRNPSRPCELGTADPRRDLRPRERRRDRPRRRRRREGPR